MVASVAASRLKREDCKRTKHDSNFSKWKMLIGPFDWEDYSLGKEAAERYRVQNLPKASSSGLYELGIAVSCTSLGREITKLDPNYIVVVYLGEADNVRTRLQHYGRSGSHLGNSYSCHLNDGKNVRLQKGPGLFEEILSKGYPIVYRWAPMQNKREAWTTETELLKTFDYAWNSSGNGVRRHDDILQTLENAARTPKIFPNISWKLLPFSQRQVGIRIKISNLLSHGKKTSNDDFEGESYSLLSRVFKISRSQPQLVSESNVTKRKNNISTCGVDLDDGSVCQKPPSEGRKRCAEHKGMKINRSTRKLVEGSRTQSNVTLVPVNLNDSLTEFPFVSRKIAKSKSFTPICGVILNDGSPCTKHPVWGRKRCDEHKGKRIHGSAAVLDKDLKFEFAHDASLYSKHHDALDHNLNPYNICGVDLGDGVSCTRKPVRGRVRCEEHKGMRVKQIHFRG